MTKRVGRNDPCPCGSGKKYKKCCEERLGPKRKFQASVLSKGSSGGSSLQGKATKISTNFFNRPAKEEQPDQPEENQPPESDPSK